MSARPWDFYDLRGGVSFRPHQVLRRRQAVRGVDLSIAPGETVALLGPNGAGKTTTIDLVLGLARPDRGAVSVFGIRPCEAVKAGAMGAMLQTGTLIEYLSVRELVTMVASLYPRPLEVNEVLRLTGIDDIADRPAAKLSGGQTQRVRFAIALVGDPGLLVLDEPTAAPRRRRSSRLLGRHARGRRARKDRPVRDPLPRGGGRLLRPDRPHGEGTYRRRRPPDRDQGEGRWQDDPGDASRRDLERLASLPGVAKAELRGDSVSLACQSSDSSDRALRELLFSFPEARDIEVRGAGSKRRSWS